MLPEINRCMVSLFHYDDEIRFSLSCRKPKVKRSPELRHPVAMENDDAGAAAAPAVQWHHVLAAAAGPPASTSDDDSGCGIEEFSWIPAGLTPAQVS